MDGGLATFDSGLPARKILRSRGEFEGAVAVGDKSAIVHAVGLVDSNERAAVVEVIFTVFAVDYERGCASWGDWGDICLVLLQACCEGLAKVIARGCGGFYGTSGVADIALHAAGDDGNTRSLDHGGSGEEGKSGGSELHVCGC